MPSTKPQAKSKRSIPVLFTAAEIKERIEAMATEIAKRNAGDLTIVALLRGSFIFAADLVRELYALGLHPEIDFMTVSSYGGGTQSSGEVKLGQDLRDDMAGRDVLIIDDILETGRTLQFATELLKSRGAETVQTAVLLEKPGKLEVKVKADYVGFSIPDKFVVGYGLDYANHYRELPFIGYMDVH